MFCDRNMPSAKQHTALTGFQQHRTHTHTHTVEYARCQMDNMPNAKQHTALTGFQRHLQARASFPGASTSMQRVVSTERSMPMITVNLSNARAFQLGPGTTSMQSMQVTNPVRRLDHYAHKGIPRTNDLPGMRTAQSAGGGDT